MKEKKKDGMKPGGELGYVYQGELEGGIGG